MWHCLTCGEAIDEVFDACWKCGTARDGTTPVDRFAEETETDSADDHLTKARIVELCSAANAFEANALQASLADAGVQSRIVGENLGNEIGVPLGDVVAPRILVREEDLARARQVLNMPNDQPRAAEMPADDEPEAGDGLPTTRGPLGCFDRGLTLLVEGFCLLIGIAVVGNAWFTQSQQLPPVLRWAYAVPHVLPWLNLGCVLILVAAALLHWQRTRHWCLLTMASGALLIALSAIAMRIVPMKANRTMLLLSAVALGMVVVAVGGVGAIQWALRLRRNK